MRHNAQSSCVTTGLNGTLTVAATAWPLDIVTVGGKTEPNDTVTGIVRTEPNETVAGIARTGPYERVTRLFQGVWGTGKKRHLFQGSGGTRPNFKGN